MVTAGRNPKGEEFRTPSLWGLRFRRPLLHDGSAPTIDQAIGRHQAEAGRASGRFAGLSKAQQADLMLLGTRSLLVKQQTQLGNAIRGHAAELPAAVHDHEIDVQLTRRIPGYCLIVGDLAASVSAKRVGTCEGPWQRNTIGIECSSS